MYDAYAEEREMMQRPTLAPAPTAAPGPDDAPDAAAIEQTFQVRRP